MDISTPSHPTSASRSPLLHNLLLFGRLLRAGGLKVTSGQLVELTSVLDMIDIRDRENFRDAARALLVNRREDIPIFERAFDLFWHHWLQALQYEGLPVEGTPHSREAPEAGESGAPSATDKGALEIVGFSAAEEGENDPEGKGSTALYSRGEALRERDFTLLSPDELDDARKFLSSLRWEIVRRRSRRSRPSRRGRKLDARRSIRHSLRHGGEMLHLAYRGPKMKRRPVVLICDISGSMDRYTRLLLHFLHSLEHRLDRTEIFVFSTRLTRITPELRRRDPDSALAAAGEAVHDWSGGTRIGDALHAFNIRWARRVMGQGAIVIIISDGWDRGEPELLAREMQRLQRQSYRLIWLNPLLGAPQYEPLTQGIRAALPSVDDFLPAHNLASLERLAEILNEVQEGRPERAQHRPVRSI